MSDGTVAISVKLEVGNGAEPEVFTAVAEVTDIPQGPTAEADDVDATSFDSEGWEETKPGIKRSGTVDAEANAVTDDPMQAQILADAETRTIRTYRINHDDATDELDVPTMTTFKGYPKNAHHTFPLGDMEKFVFQIKVTGKPATVARHAAA